jgi:nitrate/nitrite-specific signal transduction histidine kinase
VPDSKAFAENEQRFKEKLDRQLRSVNLPGEAELSRQLTTNFHAYREDLRQLASVTEAEAQHRLYDGRIVPRMKQINAALTRIRDLNHDAIMATSKAIRDINRDVTLMMIAGLAVALGISAYACFHIGRSILEPILSMTQATRALGEGKLDHKVPVSSKDELGELAGAFNKMATQLQE